MNMNSKNTTLNIKDCGIIHNPKYSSKYFYNNDVIQIVEIKNGALLCISINNNYKKESGVGWWIHKNEFKVLDKNKNPEYFL